MYQSRFILVALLSALSLSGCAVLTIDVDVYKGALANHEDVQTEQVAAMAMGAKPLLAELRYKLEDAECKKQKKGESSPAIESEFRSDAAKCPGSARNAAGTANFIPSDLLNSRDAQRVNEILSLYEELANIGADRLLQPLAQAAKRLIERINEAKESLEPYIRGAGNNLRELLSRADALSVRAREAREFQIKPQNFFGAHEPDKTHITAVRTAWESAEDTWYEAIRLLSSREIRQRLEKLPGQIIWDIAWIAAELTSGEGLRNFLTDASTPTMLTTNPLARLGSLLPALKHPTQPLTSDAAKNAVEAVLAEMLADEKIGPELAKQLAVAQGYAARNPAREWFIAVYPTKDLLARGNVFLGDLQLFIHRQNRVDISLGAGRLDSGLQKLIDEYLKARPTDGGRADGKRRRRELLFDALINFAEKVTIIANFDPLVRGKDSVYEDERKRYVRVLQAVGNSILSQVDALTQGSAQKKGLTRARDIELAGLRGAETRATAVLKNILAELTAKPLDFPGRDDILAKLGAAQDALVVAGNRIGQELVKQRDQLGKDKVAADKAIAAHSVTVRTEVKRAVETFGSAHPSVTTAEVATELARVLGEQEARSRRTDGPGSEEAQRLRLASEAMNEARFTGDTANPGPALTKYDAIVRALGRDRDDAEKAVTKLTPVVADLDRWHRQVTAMTSGGKPSLAFPGRLEKDDGDGTAKEVLDTMLATLRYEHVEAVAEDRNSEKAKSRAAAVDLLYAYRSGMVHIRPASVFLRNSYPATILQQDPTAGFWRNMLTDHAWHQLPFFEYFYGKKHAEEIEINKTIDKQFWQSVNQVRVSGVGRTNYAIAKDDVGNWYVKSYSSNPTDIIQSAKSLAMFSAGSAMGANFLANRAKPPGTPAGPGDAPTEVPTTKEARSTLAKQFDSVTKGYETQTQKKRKELRAEIEGLNGKLRGKLRGRGVADDVLATMFADPDPKDAKPDAELKTLLDTLGEDKQKNGKQKSVSMLNSEIADGLRYIRRYRATALSRIDANTSKQDPSDDPKKFAELVGEQAKKDVDKILKDLLDQFTKERQMATAQYEATLLFIGEFAGAVTAPEKTQ